tara:strand:+ start:689 stop:1480 length:792 start_codon:yes stop_codon:yes gene_type:complete
MGSAIPANQKVLGISNPERAAASTIAPPSTGEDSRSKILRRVSQLDNAVEEGFEPSMDYKWAAENDEEKFNSIYKEFEQWQEREIDKETSEADEEGLHPRIDPTDPMYDAVGDTRRRKAIEAKLKPLDFEQMVFHGHCEQEVPIKGSLTVVFRTLPTVHSLWIEGMMMELRDKPIQYGRHWLGLVQLAVSAQTINGRSIGPSLSKYTKPEHEEDFKKALEIRKEYLGNLPQVITDDLIVQLSWFMGRVRKMMTGDVSEKVGNY